MAPALLGRRYRFEGVQPGEYRLSATSRDGSKKAEVPIVVGVSGNDVVRDLVLGETVALEGILADREQKPLGGITLLLFEEGKPHWAGISRTKQDGSFRMEHLRPGRYRLRVHSTGEGTPPGMTIKEELVVLPKGRDLTATFQTVPGGTLYTQFEDERYLPYSKDRHRQSYSEPWRLSFIAKVEVVYPDGRRLKGEGLFRGRAPFSHPLPAGAYELVVTTNKHGTHRSRFVVEAGKETEVRVELVK